MATTKQPTRLLPQSESTKAGGQAQAQVQGAFHQFSKLPAELRLKVWDFNLPQSRLVSIRCGFDSPSTLESSTPTPARQLAPPTGCTSSATIPVNLHVSNESRTAALRSYRLNYGFARGPGQVYFNPECDTLYFGPREGYMAADAQFHTCMSLCDPLELAAARRLAVSDALFWSDTIYRSMTAASLTMEVLRQVRSRMPNLRELIFVPREEDSQWAPGDDALDQKAVHLRMSSQISTAIETLCRQHPDWEPPHWAILPLSALDASDCV